MIKAPPITKDLLEYLEKVFAPASISRLIHVDTQPRVIAAMAHHARGVDTVVKHLRAVYEEQQNEDPLNVSQTTKDA